MNGITWTTYRQDGKVQAFEGHVTEIDGKPHWKYVASISRTEDNRWEVDVFGFSDHPKELTARSAKSIAEDWYSNLDRKMFAVKQ